jgi:hypothetical protein
VASFYVQQMLLEEGYPSPVLVILEDRVVFFLCIVEYHLLHDLLHITQFGSKWQLFVLQNGAICVG